NATNSRYDWGIVSEIRTPMYTVTREVNPDGTVASETRGGRKTKFTYDDLSRIRVTEPPAGNAIVTEYDNEHGQSVTVGRGQSSPTAVLDGFGRPILTANSVGVQSRTTYDAEGRKIHEGYPYFGPPTNEIGTDIEYDALGRVTQRRNPDNTSAGMEYGAGTLT